MTIKPLVLIFTIITIVILPLLVNPNFIAHRNNDLARNYIPIFSFYKESAILYHQLPYWRQDQMMGENFVANPISSLFYPVNVLFIIFPVTYASIIYIWLHLLLAGYSTYYLAKTFKFNPF